MKIKITVKFSLVLSVLFIVYICISCNKNSNSNVDCQTYDYSDCDTQEPTEGNLHIKLTINDENPSVPIVIFRGKFQENIIVAYDTLTKGTYDTLLPVNNFYTVSAKYIKSGKKIIAVDGDDITKNKNKTCDSVCWSVTDGKTNVMLK